MNMSEILDTCYTCTNSNESPINFIISSIPPKNNVVLGVIGASGSGKTTFANRLREILTDSNSVIVSLDDYVCLTKKEMTDLGIETRYDWRSRDRERFLTDLQELCTGNSIIKPIQDYSEEKPSNTTETIESKPVIIVEGNLDISEYCDITIFLYASDDILAKRRFERDHTKHIHTNKAKLLSSIYTSLNYYHLFLEPHAIHADIIINTEENIVYTKR